MSTRSTGAAPLDAVVTHHLDGFRSGVARFNELLARELGVPLLGLHDAALPDARAPLLSFKVRELGEHDAAVVEALAERHDLAFELFLHEYASLPLEQRLVERARAVHCGNLAIAELVGPLARRSQVLWTPGLILDDRVFRPSEISVFSFGMAHKIRGEMFRRLKRLLDATGRSYVVYVSAANHETASLRDAESVFDEMHRLFPDTLFFLGNLSDVAITNQLAQATFFAAFFQGGVRGNNTSVAAAMERGAVVITNLDRHSPPEYVHMENVIDIEQCEELPQDGQVLQEISRRSRETAGRRSWQALVEHLAARVD